MIHKAGLKSSLRGILLWSGLFFILLLTILSIVGAFIGAQHARQFFNSIPLAAYWMTLAILLIAGIVFFHRLKSIRGLFLIDIGCVVVLAGGIWGSPAGLKIQDSLFGTNTIRAGIMPIYEGRTEKSVDIEEGGVKELPFAIKLVDFRLEYYEPGSLLIQTNQGEGFKIAAEPGMKYSLGDNFGAIEIVRLFKSFKLILEGDKRQSIDDPNGKPNAAIEILLIKPDGSEATRYAFEKFPGHVNPNDNMAFFYQRAIRKYISDVEVIKDNNVVMRKNIEVNKPLHFGGYIFYQQDYDKQAGQYTVLRVTSETGLGVVYLGFIILCAGAFWHFWLRYLFGDREIED